MMLQLSNTLPAGRSYLLFAGSEFLTIIFIFFSFFAAFHNTESLGSFCGLDFFLAMLEQKHLFNI